MLPPPGLNACIRDDGKDGAGTGGGPSAVRQASTSWSVPKVPVADMGPGVFHGACPVRLGPSLLQDLTPAPALTIGILGLTPFSASSVPLW